MQFQFVLWDFDGTLFDTYPPLIRAIQAALADLGVTVAHDDIAQRLCGTLRAARVALSARPQLSADQLTARVGYHHQQTTVRDVRPFGGAIGALERVLAAGGRNFLITHRDSDSLMRILNWYRIEGCFADIVTADDGYARKPDPESFNAIIRRHTLPRERVLAVGDRDLDVQAGIAAQVRTCLYNACPSAHAVPDYVVDTFHDLVNILFDGQGIAHFRNMGLATHLGIILSKPSIGCAKSRLTGIIKEPGQRRGSRTLIKNEAGEILGATLRTRDNVKPIFVSPGHKITLQDSIRVVLACTKGFRVSEPLRYADHLTKT